MSKELSILGFAIETERLVEEDGDSSRPYVSVNVRLLVNGKEPTKTHTFDARTVVAYGARSCHVDLYTCSCGVAGCAGIHDDVAIVANADTVTWTFPEDPFRAQFDAELFPADRPLQVQFDTRQYLQALADLEAQLFELVMSSEEHAALVPYTYPDFDRVIGEELVSAKDWADKRLAHIAYLKSMFQHLYDQEVLVEWPNGAMQCAGVVSLAQELAFRRAEALKLDPEAEDATRYEIMERDIAPAFVASDEAIFAMVRAIPWADRRGIFWGTGKSRKNPPATGWETATFSLRAMR